MAAFINTNIASLNAQRNLNASQGALQTSLQRLSSGLRINSAKDDAAGLAIADRFSTQIRGLNQAVRNANDGISLAQTAEGSLGEIGNNLQRIRELAVQAANSTNSASDRAAINQEVQQRLAEIDRTSSQTSFNGQKILDGSFGSANFQVGANAGETISFDLETSMRTASIGKIATAESAVLGATSTNGNIAVTSTNLNYGTAGSDATAGRIAVTAANLNYGTAGATAVDGSNASTLAGALAVAGPYNLSTAASAQVDANAVVGGGGVTDFDYSGAGLAQFNVDIAGSTTTTVGITLNSSYGSGAALATAIQDQIQATAGNEAVTVTFNAGSLTFTNTGKEGAGNAITLSNQDTAASAAGADFDVVTASNGSAATSGTTATFTVSDGTGNGASIVLDGAAYADQDAIAAAITAQLAGDADTASMTAAYNSGTGTITITNAGSPTAVAITGSNQAAVDIGFVSDAGTAGNATTTTTNATLTVDGNTITLDGNYADYNALASALQTKLNTASGGSNFTVTSNNNTSAISIQRTTTGVGSTAVNIAGADSNAQAGLTLGAATASGTTGADAVATTNGTFYIDGNEVTLDQDYANQNAVAADIQSQLTAAGYTASNNAGVITIAKTGSLDAVKITGADTNATNGGFAFATGTAGVAGGSVTLASGDFSIAVGADEAVDMAGTYADTQALADAINKNVNNVYASVSSGKLVLSSASALTLGGDEATGDLGFASTSVAATTGSLDDSNTLTVSGALSTIQRVDAALNSVNGLRSTFGAIQNRFESVISNLSSTSENLSAARSRIQDADFAAETATLTRGQILQQAGTAMLAQANSLPNGVLALLRG